MSLRLHGFGMQPEELQRSNDVFYQFDEAYAKHAALDANSENINARYPWYYLNTYVTNGSSLFGVGITLG